ncbi:HCc2, partial [Symbiodinium sp. CCMP2456]
AGDRASERAAEAADGGQLCRKQCDSGHGCVSAVAASWIRVLREWCGLCPRDR